MAELKLSGNHLKGSRPVLSFDAAFNDQPHFQVIKELLSQIFATPNRHHKAKPFFDHVISFTIADGRIWMRNYQVVPDPAAKQSDFKAISLVEVGPRACLNPILIMSGGFGGPIVYSNPGYVSPNAIRAALKKKAQTKYVSKVNSRQQRKEHKESNTLPLDELNDVFR
jgi:ribosome biogenesis protein BRX1